MSERRFLKQFNVRKAVQPERFIPVSLLRPASMFVNALQPEAESVVSWFAVTSTRCNWVKLSSERSPAKPLPRQSMTVT